MRIGGWLKITAVLLADAFLVYKLFGYVGSAVIISVLLFYAWIGEHIDLLRDGAISVENMNDYERTRMEHLQKYLMEDVRRLSDIDISGIRLHVIPSNVPNACAYGFRHIAVTRPALDNCDDATLCAVLAHEVSHILCLDAVFRRIMFANVTGLILYLSICSLVSMSFLLIAFLFLALCFHFFRGFFGILLFQGLGKAVRGVYSVLQYGILFLYRTVMGLVSRTSEFRADSFSCSLGYGQQLQYYLERFADQQDQERRFLREILYATHPATWQRIARIEQQMNSSVPDRNLPR